MVLRSIIAVSGERPVDQGEYQQSRWEMLHDPGSLEYCIPLARQQIRNSYVP